MPSTQTLTGPQLVALKNDILTHPELVGQQAAEVAAWYNQPTANPTWIVWKTLVSASEWSHAILSGVGAATQLDALSASKRESLLWAIDHDLDPSVLEVRAALDDFCGTQQNLKAAIQAVQKRTATRAERLFASGTGSSASPGTMTFEGALSYLQVEQAWSV